MGTRIPLVLGGDGLPQQLQGADDLDDTSFADLNPNVGTFGDSTHVPQVTVDAKGRVTAAAAVAITAGGGSLGLSLAVRCGALLA